MILDVWRTALCRIMAGETVVLPCYTMIGDGNTPAAGTDTTLDNELSRKEITSVSRPTDFSVRYESIWNSTEQNGDTVCETGLVNASLNGDAVNRKVFPSFEKQSTFEVRVQTEIKFEEA